MKKARQSPGAMAAWIERHANHVGDECFLWPFARRGTGRGSLLFRGNQMTPARAMCIAAHGDPKGLADDAAHICRNGNVACVNPNHLRWATRKENLADRIVHGTAGIKLTPEQVYEIRDAQSEDPLSLAKRYSVSRQTIQKIRQRKLWILLPERVNSQA